MNRIATKITSTLAAIGALLFAMQASAQNAWPQKPITVVVPFAAGGVATPADAALMMRLGADGVFVGSGIFKSENPPLVAKAIVEATTHFQDAEVIARVSRGLGKAMPGISVSSLPEKELLATRGW